jgi:hypothetical protein
MKATLPLAALLLLTLAFPHDLAAQYWGERVLEKGFEHTDFFFVPSNLMPFGIGSFKTTMAGLLDDPLLNLAVSPAHVRVDSAGYLYADFRSARTIHDQGPSYVVPWLAYANSDLAYRPYPWFYLNTRKELEPAFSGAYLIHPAPETLPDLLLGASYQLILQDDKYYNIPQDIYRSIIGADYAGNEAAASSSIPIVDRYSGQDNMHQRGHFISAVGQYVVPAFGSFGLKIGRVTFDRSGGFGSANLWGNPVQGGGTSLWSSIEARSQGYGHWELTGGADFFVSSKTIVGATAGWLWGDASQALHRNDSSYYKYTSRSVGSFYMNSGNTQEEWQHSGRTLLLGCDVTSHITPRHTIRLLYQRQQTTVDLDVRSAILDTSYSTYSYTYEGTQTTSTSYSLVQDSRAGTGRQTSLMNRVLASLQWQIEDRVNLALGAQLDWQTTETNTTEGALARTQSTYQTSSGNYGYISGSDESKDLLWTFTAERTSFRIPIFLTIKASEAIDIHLGLNRTMTRSKVDDVTLALFRYRQTNANGTITRQEDFGERYTTPTEEISDVQTTFLAGLTASASSHFRVRLLVVPNFHDTFDGSELEQLQWWVGVNLIP